MTTSDIQIMPPHPECMKARTQPLQSQRTVQSQHRDQHGGGWGRGGVGWGGFLLHCLTMWVLPTFKGSQPPSRYMGSENQQSVLENKRPQGQTRQNTHTHRHGMFYPVTRGPGDSEVDLISFMQRSTLVGGLTCIIRGGEQSRHF